MSDFPKSSADGYPVTELWTFQDMVDHVLDLFEIDNNRNERMAKRAVLNAYRDMPFKHRWSYYERLQSVQTEAEVDLTCTYDHTGGSSERLLTASSGTFPATAARGWVIIDDDRYEVDTYIDSTNVTLSENSNPGADVSSSAVTWYRNSYPLHVSFRRARPVVELANSWVLDYVSPGELHQLEVGNYQPSRPYAYTFHNDGDFYGSMSLTFIPPPSEARVYEFMVDASPRPLTTYKKQEGTVTVSSGSTTVTGTDTNFKSSDVGSIIRFSGDGARYPTSIIGSQEPYPEGTENTYVAQRVITAVASTTSATINEEISASTTYTNVLYTISDPLDLEPGSMFSYFQRLCEYEMARFVRNDELPMYKQQEMLALRDAMAFDNRNKDLGSGVSPRKYQNIRDWAIIE